MVDQSYYMFLFFVEDKDDRARTPPTNVAWHNCRKMILVQRSVQKGTPVGFWPLPESFWPDLQSSQLVRNSSARSLPFQIIPKTTGFCVCSL